MSWAAGIDLGGTNVKAVAVAADGTVLCRAMLATRDGADAAGGWVEVARELMAEFSRELGSAAVVIGVGAPGLAAADGRSIAYLPGRLAGLERLDWTVALGRTTPVPVLNDAHAALLGEAWTGAAAGKRDVVMLTLGTGVGGAVMSDGRLLRGARGRAGHLGHVSLDPEGAPSIAGMPGALELQIGDCTVAARSGGRFLTTAELVGAHRAGDAAATVVWRRAVRALACALGGAINVLDPEIVVLGGGIAQAGEALFAPLAEEMERCEWRPGGARVPIVPAALGEWAGAIGAARNALTGSGQLS